ncbi:MAG: hypothetical protein J0I83_11370 [Nitrobacter sp.]|nr:hypothetical protein [Nitrobacter sp.]
MTPGIRVAFSSLIWCVSGATVRIVPLFDLRARDPPTWSALIAGELDFGFKLRKSIHQQIDDTGRS